MIVDNIEAMKHYDVADTVVMANDTIVESVDGKVISSIPNRTHMYQDKHLKHSKFKPLLTCMIALQMMSKKF